MAKTIQQKATFKAKAAKLYALYADSKLHSAATGQKASVGAEGGKFSAFGGVITGKILQTVKNKSIVQTWRAKAWKKADADSILILTFEDTKAGGRVSMVHANVADSDAKGVTALLKKIGKVRTGKSCLYIKRLEDVDLKVLGELVGRSVRFMTEKYG